MDFGAGYGAPIYAVTDGVIAYAGRKGGYGNFVQINHGGGLATGYGHMSRIATSSGQRVRRGQIIGYVGSTGLSTGPHLHYELYRGGRAVNPMSVKFTQRAQLERQRPGPVQGQAQSPEIGEGRRGACADEAYPAACKKNPSAKSTG